jgi:Zn-dependent peptidase ImmA (M78 family)
MSGSDEIEPMQKQKQQLERGFKSYAEALAAEVRHEIGLSPFASMDPWKLATLLDIPIVSLSDFAEVAPSAVRRLAGEHRSQFSAATIFNGSRRMIIHNDSHSIVRQRSNICHELAHGLLNHPPIIAFNEAGCRNFDVDREAEATCLAGALLVSPQAAVRLARSRIPLSEAAAQLEVSNAMMRWRMNVTGAIRRATNRARRTVTT